MMKQNKAARSVSAPATAVPKPAPDPFDRALRWSIDEGSKAIEHNLQVVLDGGEALRLYSRTVQQLANSMTFGYAVASNSVSDLARRMLYSIPPDRAVTVDGVRDSERDHPLVATLLATADRASSTALQLRQHMIDLYLASVSARNSADSPPTGELASQ